MAVVFELQFWSEIYRGYSDENDGSEDPMDVVALRGGTAFNGR